MENAPLWGALDFCVWSREKFILKNLFVLHSTLPIYTSHYKNHIKFCQVPHAIFTWI
jgi:hypothetical protein